MTEFLFWDRLILAFIVVYISPEDLAIDFH